MNESDTRRVLPFFVDADRRKVLDDFINRVERMDIGEVGNKYLSRSKIIITAIHHSPQDWDKRCEFNIKHIGRNFLQLLPEFISLKPPYVEYVETAAGKIYVLSYRFLCEFDFFVGDGQPLFGELDLLKYEIQQDSAERNEHVRSGISYASYLMPANIVKEFLNNPDIGIFKDFQNKKLEADNLKEKWDQEIKDKQQTVDDLKNKLEKYKTGFNFVGLYQGFSGLVQKKEKESSLLFWSLFVMGFIIAVAPLVGGKIWPLVKWDDPASLMTTISLISLDIILIYFFRVILLNHRSVKTQIMQIELRQTLCQFIQSYAEYSAKIKKQDSSALEKFENLIFSGLLSNREKLPGTFDGLKPVVDLIKNIKSSP